MQKDTKSNSNDVVKVLPWESYWKWNLFLNVIIFAISIPLFVYGLWSERGVFQFAGIFVLTMTLYGLYWPKKVTIDSECIIWHRFHRLLRFEKKLLYSEVLSLKLENGVLKLLDKNEKWHIVATDSSVVIGPLPVLIFKDGVSLGPHRILVRLQYLIQYRCGHEMNLEASYENVGEVVKFKDVYCAMGNPEQNWSDLN